MITGQLQAAKALLSGHLAASALDDTDLLSLGCAMGRAPHIARMIEAELAHRLGVNSQSEMNLALPPAQTTPAHCLKGANSARAYNEKLRSWDYWQAMPEGWFTVETLSASIGKEPEAVRQILRKMAKAGYAENGGKWAEEGQRYAVSHWRKVAGAQPPKPPEPPTSKWLAVLTPEWQTTADIAAAMGSSRGHARDMLHKLRKEGKAELDKRQVMQEQGSASLTYFWRIKTPLQRKP